MELGSILILMAILLPVLAYLAQPILSGQGREVGKREMRLSALEAERDRLISTIQEMEVDYSMGKMDLADYEAERSALITRGADTMRQIDALMGKKVALEVTSAEEVDQSLEAELEARVAQMRKVQTEVYCPQCGARILESDRFCGACGADVNAGEGST